MKKLAIALSLFWVSLADAQTNTTNFLFLPGPTIVNVGSGLLASTNTVGNTNTVTITTNGATTSGSIVFSSIFQSPFNGALLGGTTNQWTSFTGAPSVGNHLYAIQGFAETLTNSGSGSPVLDIQIGWKNTAAGSGMVSNVVVKMPMSSYSFNTFGPITFDSTNIPSYNIFCTNNAGTPYIGYGIQLFLLQ